MPHHKQIKHYEQRPELHELTFSCFQQLPLLDNVERLAALSMAVDRAQARHGWKLCAFVFMPTHVHLLAFPESAKSGSVSDLLFAIKRPHSYRMKVAMQGTKWMDRLTVQQRPGVTAFRFWQEGPGYDRNIRSERAAIAAIEYLHLNPVRKDLASKAVDWLWSSAAWYGSDGQQVDSRLPQLSSLPSEFFADGADATAD